MPMKSRLDRTFEVVERVLALSPDQFEVFIEKLKDDGLISEDEHADFVMAGKCEEAT